MPDPRGDLAGAGLGRDWRAGDVARTFARMADADWAAFWAAVAAVTGQPAPVEPLPPRRWREGRPPGQDCRRAMADLARSHTDDPDEWAGIDFWFGVERGGGAR